MSARQRRRPEAARCRWPICETGQLLPAQRYRPSDVPATSGPSKRNFNWSGRAVPSPEALDGSVQGDRHRWRQLKREWRRPLL